MAECFQCGRTSADDHILGASCPLDPCAMRPNGEEPADAPAAFQAASEADDEEDEG